MKWLYNSILAAWAIFVIGGAIYLLKLIPPAFGEIWGSLFIVYIVCIIGIAFVGRFVIEKIINSIRGKFKE